MLFIQKQLADMASSVPQPDRNSLNTITEEAVSPVIAKCLSKATTPPVTIKSFFKPSKPNSNGGSSGGGGGAKGGLQKCNGELVFESAKASGSAQAKVKHVVAKTETKGTKRPLESESSLARPTKKAKQVNIMASFAKQKSKKEEQEEVRADVPGL